MNESVEAYFKTQPEETRSMLLDLRACILDAAPEATELINYSIPTYSLVKDGKRDQQIMIAGHKNHVGLYPHPAVIEKFNSELVPYKKGKGSVQFPLNKPLPRALIVKMVKYRLELLKSQKTKPL